MAESPEPLATPEAQFREMVERPEADIDLARAALLIAKSTYRDLDVGFYVSRIDDLARRLRAQLPEDAGEADLIVGLNRFLFEEQGFAPNLQEYYDPRNSYLNEVLDRRVGIPITLSILYLEVGWRVGLPLRGVSFPGHFLVKCTVKDGMVILDPYCGGISLSLQDLQQRLREMRGGEVSRAIVAGLLVAASKKEIIARMLRNLKAIHLERGEATQALATMHGLVAVAPADPHEVRDRGLAYLRLECFRAALDDLERYLEMAPRADDLDEIRGHVVALRRSTARLN